MKMLLFAVQSFFEYGVMGGDGQFPDRNVESLWRDNEDAYLLGSDDVRVEEIAPKNEFECARLDMSDITTNITNLQR